MKSILFLSCSPKGPTSHSVNFAEEVLARLQQHHPTAEVRRRDLAANPPSFVDAVFATANTDPASLPHLFGPSEGLIEELELADALVLATPMHNYTVPAVLKAWIDQIVRIHRSFASTPGGKVGKLHDRPVFVVIASGGWFSGPSPIGTPAQPDFLTPYLGAVLNTIGLHTLHFIALEGVSRGPAEQQRAIMLARHQLDHILPEPGTRAS
jgi:FMN-dependent NADH-azoreductase